MTWTIRYVYTDRTVRQGCYADKTMAEMNAKLSMAAKLQSDRLGMSHSLVSATVEEY